MKISNKKIEPLLIGTSFLILTTIISIGGAFLLSNSQLSQQNNKFNIYNQELVFSLIFGMVISFPDFFAEIKKKGILFFDLKRFLIFAIPVIVLIIIEFSLISSGSLFFSKMVTYFLVAMFSYSFLSSFKRKENLKEI